MYNKLFTKILDSSIWLEPSSTRIVWMTFLAVMDEDGFVELASVANVAHRAIVSLEEATKAIECLESPDLNSSNPDNEGRRIERVDGGWIVLNAPIYRDLASREKKKEADRNRQREKRSRKVSQNVAKSSLSDTDTDTESETENTRQVVSDVVSLALKSNCRCSKDEFVCLCARVGMDRDTSTEQWEYLQRVHWKPKGKPIMDLKRYINGTARRKRGELQRL